MNNPLASLAVNTETPEQLILESPLTGQPIYDVNGVPAHIWVLSSDGAVGRKARHALQQRLMKSRGKGEITPEEMDAHGFELCAALTTGWHLVNLETNEPIEFPFNHQNALSLYGNAATTWIKEAVDSFAGSRSNFMKRSKPNSLNGPGTSSDSMSGARTDQPTENT